MIRRPPRSTQSRSSAASDVYKRQEVGLGPVHIVLDGDTAVLPQKRDRAPQFSAHLYCVWMHHGATWYGGRPQPRRLCYMGTEPPAPKGAEPHPIFGPVYCGQTAAWIKMPLGTQVDLGLRDIVFDVDPVIPRKRAHPPHPIFGPCLLWPNGWMDEDNAWYGSRPRPRSHCTRRGSSSRERGTCLLWPRSPISATAELLLENV